MRRAVSSSLAFWLVAVAFAVTMIGTTLPTPLYVYYQRELGFSNLTSTVVFAAYAVGVLAALLLLGRLSDVIGRRNALLPGLASAMLSAVVFLFADNLALLLVGRMLSGISAGIFTGTATAALFDLADAERRERATVVATVANMGGLGAGPLLAGLLAQFSQAPLQLPFEIHLGMLALVSIGVWRMPETVPAQGRPGFTIARLRLPPEVRGTFARAALAGFAGFAVLGLFTAVAPAFLRRLLHVSAPAWSGGIVFTVFSASALGQIILVGRLRERALSVGCAILTSGAVLLAVALARGSLVLLVLAAIVVGGGQGTSFRAGLVAVNAAAPPRQRAEVASLFVLVLYLALSVPVVGVGLAADAYGLRVAGIACALVVATLASIALVLISRRRSPSSG
ncbi:MAG: MFS transporter [Kofleriaceae bacterium]|nr:MFS transporter [Kofleriaceae bacterium]